MRTFPGPCIQSFGAGLPFPSGFRAPRGLLVFHGWEPGPRSDDGRSGVDPQGGDAQGGVSRGEPRHATRSGRFHERGVAGELRPCGPQSRPVGDGNHSWHRTRMGWCRRAMGGPARSMQHLCSSSVRVTGPGPCTEKLPVPAPCNPTAFAGLSAELAEIRNAWHE